MRKMLMLSVAMAGMAVAPAFAQLGATQTPPSPNAGSQMPQPANSAPLGTTAPAQQAHPTGSVATSVVGAQPGTPAVIPHRRRMMRAAPAHQMQDQAATDGQAMGDQNAPPTSAYNGGTGSPLSTRATNLTPSRGEGMGSRLPTPATAGNTPRDLLAAADNALARGQTGAAQQALEMAETRILTRTTDPSMANAPDQQAMVQAISGARRALGANDLRGARQMIQSAMSDRVPPPGPAVTTTPGVMPGQPKMRTY